MYIFADLVVSFLPIAKGNIATLQRVRNKRRCYMPPNILPLMPKAKYGICQMPT